MEKTMELVKKAVEIQKKYRQHKNCETYTNNFSDYYREVLRVLPKSKSTIDIGCAYGTLALALSIRGDKVTATDMTTEYINKKMLKDNGIRFEKWNVEKSTKSIKADLITMTETIEHLNSNPLKAILNIKASLNPKGKIFISTVAREIHGDTTSMNTGRKGLWNDIISWRDIPEYDGEFKDEHTFHYTQFDLISLLDEAGFNISKVGVLGNFSNYIIGENKDIKDETKHNHTN